VLVRSGAQWLEEESRLGCSFPNRAHTAVKAGSAAQAAGRRGDGPGAGWSGWIGCLGLGSEGSQVPPQRIHSHGPAYDTLWDALSRRRSVVFPLGGT
jgi:hypothetical protein